MGADRSSVLWVLILLGGGVMQIVNLPMPVWLNDGLAYSSMTLVALALIMMGILEIHRHENVQILGLNIGGQWVTHTVKNQYTILVVAAVITFVVGAYTLPSKSNDLTNHTSLAVDASNHIPVVQPTVQPKEKTITNQPSEIEVIVKTSDKPTSPVLTPRTPKELMDLVITQTKRDAMHHQGSLIRVEGTILDISEVQPWISKNSTVAVTVVVGFTSGDYKIPQKVNLVFDAERWKTQVDKLARGDKLVANGVVENIWKIQMEVTNARIISVSGLKESNQ